MIKEEYRNIPDDQFVPLKDGIDPIFWGNYEINKKGEIKCISTGKIYTKYNLWKNEMPRKSFRSENVKKNYRIHRLLAITFLENPNNYEEVDHIDRNTTNYSLSNLRWVDRKTNLLNRGNLQRKTFCFAKLDDNKNEIERIPYTSFQPSEVQKIATAIRAGCRYNGNYWKRIDLDLENFISANGINLDKVTWIKTNIPGVEASPIGLIKVDGTITLGWDSHGYRRFSKDKKVYNVHRVIYETFSGTTIPDDMVVDHIDTNTYNNNFSNLRVVTKSGNMNNSDTKSKLSKPVDQFSLSGEFIKSFSSTKDASESIKGDRSSIQLCCVGKSITSFGFIWCYKDDKKMLEDKLTKIICKFDKTTKELVACYANREDAAKKNGFKAKDLYHLGSDCRKIGVFIYQLGTKPRF